jgi:hypothetical protein
MLLVGGSMTRTLERTLAVLTISAAVLLPLNALLPLFLLDPSATPLDWVRTSSWPLLSQMAVVLAALMPFVVLALYVCQIEETGKLGFVGLVLTLIGYLAYMWFQFDMAFVWPVLAARAPELIDYSGPMFRDARFAFVHLWMGVVQSVGVLLLGAALFRARVFPRTTSALLTIGLLLSAGVLFPPFVLSAIGGVVGAIALGWIGRLLWSRSPAST